MDKDLILTKISENIRLARLKRRYTQEALAEKAGITQKYLNMIENKNANPSIVIVVNICEALNIELNSLLIDIV
ncbi:helix-turn-helix transcriptional regulator [bacterium]|nr:helix-turn-helix transcriptional regulator [bacterium]